MPETHKASTTNSESNSLGDSDLEEFIGYNLKRAYMILQSDFRRTLRDDGLSARSFSALSLVVQYPNITQSALSKQMGIERSGLVAIVDELESMGYIVRKQIPADRRAQALKAVSKGKSAYKKAVKKVQKHEQQLFAHMTASEQKTLMKLLKKIRLLERDQSAP